MLEQTSYYLALRSMSRYFISKSREHNSPVCSRFPADYTDGPFISLAVEFEIFSVLFTFSIYVNGFRWWRTRTKAFQIVQFGNKVLHQVVFSETPLVEHLRSKEGTLVTTFFLQCLSRSYILTDVNFPAVAKASYHSDDSHTKCMTATTC